MAKITKPVRLEEEVHNRLIEASKNNKFRLNIGKLANLAIIKGLPLILKEMGK